jgi:SAM-dependent methyltransferase
VKDYVREYFDRHAGAWVESAYAGGARFPVGPERVRLAIEGVAPAVPAGGALVDLGCGGGQLVAHAAQLGWRAVGVDVAPGMIDEARAATAGLDDVELVVAPYDETGLASGSFDAVTAIGLIEYLPDDDGLFAEAARLLRRGGRVAVSCRNRLYNVQSANRFTARELERGDAAALLAELREGMERVGTQELYALAEELAAAGDELVAAAEADAAGPAPDLFDHPTTFGEERRQHTPAVLAEAAARAGLRPIETLAVHPHPLPPDLERLAPRFYNRLALAWQRPLERSPLGLAFSTAFVAVFEC